MACAGCGGSECICGFRHRLGELEALLREIEVSEVPVRGLHYVRVREPSNIWSAVSFEQLPQFRDWDRRRRILLGIPKNGI